MEETKSLKEFKSRERKAKEEIEKQFPYLKEIKKKEEETKKKVEEEKKDVGVAKEESGGN